MRLSSAIVISLVSVGIAHAEVGSPPHGSVMLEPIGFAVYPILSRGLEVGWYATANDLLTTSYATGKHSRLLTDYRTELALLRYRRQLSSLTHVNLGFGYRGLGQVYKIQRDDGSQVSHHAETQLLILETSLGNHLRLGLINLSCDWLGIVVPIAPYRDHKSSPDGVDPSEQEENQDALERVAWVPTLQLMRVSMGISF